MEIRLNGERCEVPAQTVEQLLEWLHSPNAGVAVALNGQVVPAAQRNITALKDDDQVEVIHAVQGG